MSKTSLFAFVDLPVEAKTEWPPLREGRILNLLLPRREYDYPSTLTEQKLTDALKKLSGRPTATIEDYSHIVPPFHYVWDGLEVRYDDDFPERGAGVFATRNLPKGLTFPYYAYIYSSQLFPNTYLDSL